MSPKIVHYRQYVAGWIDSSIHDFLPFLGPDDEAAKYALITCLDSNPEPASLANEGRHWKAMGAVRLGKGLLVPARRLIRMDADRQVLFGFDELWFFPHRPAEPKPTSASLVGPARISQPKLNKLGAWMSRNQCSLALGDGDGLNFVMLANGLVGKMLGSTISRPARAVMEPSQSA